MSVAESVAEAVEFAEIVVVCLFDHEMVRRVLDPVADRRAVAVPSMIGTPGPSVYYSGSRAVFDGRRELLEKWGAAECFGDDTGLAALHDLALRSAMYVMFAGLFHGAAMVATAGKSATEFAGRVVTGPAADPRRIRRDHRRRRLHAAGAAESRVLRYRRNRRGSGAAGIRTEVVDTVQRLIRRQIDTGHGAEGCARAIESTRNPVGTA